MSHLFVTGGQNIGASASISALPMNIQDLFPLGWTGWISLQSKGLSRVFSNTTVQMHKFFDSHSVSHSVVSLCDPMDCTTPGFPVHHQFPEFAQTHVHRVGDAIQPSHLLSSLSPPALNL